MALNDKRKQAEDLYVKGGLSCAAIAEKVGVNEGTVYRWKADAEKGEASDWEQKRRLHNLSPNEMFAVYAESVKEMIVKIQQNPDLLLDGKVADAIAKHVSVLRKLDTRGQYKGVALDLIKVTNTWLAENHPELKEKIDPHWDAIFSEFIKYTTEKGLF
jgi:transposase